VAQRDQRDQTGVMSALALLGQLGLCVAVPTAVGAVVGTYAARRLNAGGVAVVAAILAGLAAGLYAAYRLIKKEIRWKP